MFFDKHHQCAMCLIRPCLKSYDMLSLICSNDILLLFAEWIPDCCRLNAATSCSFCCLSTVRVSNCSKNLPMLELVSDSIPSDICFLNPPAKPFHQCKLGCAIFNGEDEVPSSQAWIVSIATTKEVKHPTRLLVNFEALLKLVGANESPIENPIASPIKMIRRVYFHYFSNHLSFLFHFFGSVMKYFWSVGLVGHGGNESLFQKKKVFFEKHHHVNHH